MTPSPRSSPRRAPDPVRTDPLSTDWGFEALGTVWEITTDRPLSERARAAVGAELDRIDRFWSRFRPDSTVAEMSRRAGRYRLAREDRCLLEWYRELYDATGGAVTPLVGQILDDAGYDADYSLTPDRTVPAPAWDDVIDWDGTELVVRTPVLLDVGAAGKGFAVDRVASIVADHAERYLVDAGGDMVISPRDEPVRIALEHPLDPTKAIGLVELTGGALCASAANRRVWGDWHHIVDPRTAAPTREVMATWVYARDAMTADGLATALFFTAATELSVLGARHGWAPALSVGSDIAGFRFAGTDVPDHVAIRGNGVVEHTTIPGLELFV